MGLKNTKNCLECKFSGCKHIDPNYTRCKHNVKKEQCVVGFSCGVVVPTTHANECSYYEES